MSKLISIFIDGLLSNGYIFNNKLTALQGQCVHLENRNFPILLRTFTFTPRWKGSHRRKVPPAVLPSSAVTSSGASLLRQRQ